MADKYPLIRKNGVIMELPLGDSIINSRLFWAGDRGVFAGGWALGNPLGTIDYITISTTGNATSFGSLGMYINWKSEYLYGNYGTSGVGNGTRGIFHASWGYWYTEADGGYYYEAYANVLYYITIATTNNGTEFGSLSGQGHFCYSCNNTTRGIFAGRGQTNIIDYITIATTGNATDFGDMTVAKYLGAGISGEIRGVFCNGQTASSTNIIDYITIATTGNATDFGDSIGQGYGVGSVSNGVRGIYTYSTTSGVGQNAIDYITIASTGNSADFGDLTVSRYGTAGTSNGTRGTFAGGYSPTKIIIDYITINSLGNATTFGDLTTARFYLGACS